MRIADWDNANQHRVLSGTTQINNKYSVEITLYNFDKFCPIEVIWDPHLPSDGTMKRLQPRIDEALIPFQAKLLELSGLLEAGEE